MRLDVSTVSIAPSFNPEYMFILPVLIFSPEGNSKPPLQKNLTSEAKPVSSVVPIRTRPDSAITKLLKPLLLALSAMILLRAFSVVKPGTSGNVSKTCSAATKRMRSGPKPERSLPLNIKSSVLPWFAEEVYNCSFIIQLPNSSPVIPPKVSWFPMTTSPLTSNLPRGTSVPIPILPEVPSIKIRLFVESLITLGFLVSLKSPVDPVIPIEYPVGLPAIPSA